MAKAPSQADFLGLIDADIAAALQEDDTVLYDILSCTMVQKVQASLVRICNAAGVNDNTIPLKGISSDRIPSSNAVTLVQAIGFLESTLTLVAYIIVFMRDASESNANSKPIDSTMFPIVKAAFKELRRRFTQQWPQVKASMRFDNEFVLMSHSDFDTIMLSLVAFVDRVGSEVQAPLGHHDWASSVCVCACVCAVKFFLCGMCGFVRGGMGLGVEARMGFTLNVGF